MVEHSKGKRVPYSQMEEYLEAHQGLIGSYVYQVNNKIIEKAEVEAKLPKSFLQLHQVITKILRANDVLPK
jgi:hypothetical protein